VPYNITPIKHSFVRKFFGPNKKLKVPEF